MPRRCGRRFTSCPVFASSGCSRFPAKPADRGSRSPSIPRDGSSPAIRLPPDCFASRPRRSVRGSRRASSRSRPGCRRPRGCSMPLAVCTSRTTATARCIGCATPTATTDSTKRPGWSIFPAAASTARTDCGFRPTASKSFWWPAITRRCRSRSRPIRRSGWVACVAVSGHATITGGGTCRLSPNWDEDLLLPRQWDAGGHAVGLLAPAGWIAGIDPDGKQWDLRTIGFRNAYDIALNADGELFTYDSDPEWDLGTPWYRPTRILHAVSGADFGWRAGYGCWPPYRADSLPAAVDVGPGSPVGLEFGYGTKFPAKYQRALIRSGLDLRHDLRRAPDARRGQLHWHQGRIPVAQSPPLDRCGGRHGWSILFFDRWT